MSEKIANSSSRPPVAFSRRRFLQMAGLFSLGMALPCSDKPRRGTASKGFYDSVFESLLSEASARRNSHLIDEELNRKRVNALLFSYGELYEPSEREGLVTIGSPTIVSLSSKSIDFISITHEVRAPEVERYLQKAGKFDEHAKTIDQAFFRGGFGLLGPAVESVTGLSVDYQVACNEAVVADVIDQLYGSIEVDIPRGFTSLPFYFRGNWYPMDRFPTGKELMSGRRAIQFMKTMPYEKVYDLAFENTTRKHVLLESLMKAFKGSGHGLGFWWKAISLLRQEFSSGDLSHDIDLGSLLLSMVGSLTRTSAYSLDIPKTGVELYVSDPANSNLKDGLGGMQWIRSSQNPIFQRELRSGFYHEKAIKVPFDSVTSFQADPYSQNLVHDYWKPIRSRIRRSLSEVI